MMRRSLLAFGLVLAAIVAGLARTPSQPPQAPPPAQPASSRPGPASQLGDAAGVAAFADAFFTEQMRARAVPGAVFVLVEGGRVLAAKGYGYADLATRRPVDAARTVFRAGSVSKVLTAMAVLQLEERGRLRLDEDVNAYLRLFALPDTFPQPVTLSHLLTHTGGFDGRHIAMHARNAADFTPLGPFLARRMPARVLPPGEVIAYNDFGMSLAGHIVETASGLSFDRYVEDRIFRPLGMASSTFSQPMPPDLMARIATGYALRGGTAVPYPYDLVEVSPAAALQTTGRDMTAFIIACLQHGRYGERRVLEEATAVRMMTRQVSHHPRIRGRAFGFSELFVNGQRVVFHDGGMPGFVARIALLPDRGIGFFMAANADQQSPAGPLAGEFTAAFFDRYFPVPPPPPVTPPADFGARAARFTGYYRSLHEYSGRTMEKAVSLGEQVRLEDDGAGALRLGRNRLIEVEPLLFRWSDAPSFVAFTEAQGGAIARMFIGTAAYEKLSWFETRPVQLALAGSFVLLFIAAPLAAFLVKGGPGAGRTLALGRWLIASQTVLALLFLAGMFLAITRIDIWEFTQDLPVVVAALLVLPFITLAVAAGLLALAAGAWRRRAGAAIAAVLATAGIVGVAFVGWLYYWNMVGFRT